MLGKNNKIIEWIRMPAQDQTYLITAYKNYESLFRSTGESSHKIEDFQGWLLKRGIRKQISNTIC